MALKGHAYTRALNVETVAKKLPRPPGDTGLRVIITGPYTAERMLKTLRQWLVRRSMVDKVLVCLVCLPVCPSACLPVCLPVWLPVWLPEWVLT
jgi:hypothetical protein